MNQIVMHSNSVKALSGKITLFALFIICLCNSCKKVDNGILTISDVPNSETKFFKMKGNTNSTVLRINNSLKVANSKTEFVSKFIKYAGYPRWEKSFFLPNRNNNQTQRLNNLNTDSTYIIPVVAESVVGN